MHLKLQPTITTLARITIKQLRLALAISALVVLAVVGNAPPSNGCC